MQDFFAMHAILLRIFVHVIDVVGACKKREKDRIKNSREGA
jgi:hypothetical protein